MALRLAVSALRGRARIRQKLFCRQRKSEMKIALIRRRFSATGGAELYTNRLCGELLHRGHEVQLFAQEWSDDVPWVRVPGNNSRSGKSVCFAYNVEKLLRPADFDCVFSLERTFCQDVYRAGDGVHRHWLQQLRRFAPFWKKPFIGFGLYHRRMLKLETKTFSPANTGYIIVNSELVGREIRNRFAFPAERIHLIRNGIEYEKFSGARRQRDEARKRFGFAPDDFVLLFIGSGWTKGLAFLLKAFKNLAGENLKLLVAGKSKHRWPPMRRVLYAGPVRSVEMAFAAADLFVSLSISDASANACFEAMAAGLPVITTQFDGASELIQPGRNGSVLADPRDTRSVIEAIEYWRKKRAPESVIAPEEISLERNVSETISILERAAQEKSR
jgi:UDP-glucose:(heptosyl)LPS alpha-1,3-glucosyltransferase